MGIEEIEERVQMRPKPGIYPGVPFPEYQSWEAINNSVLRKISKQSAAHAKEYMDNPPPPTAAMSFGSALHARILECDTFPERYLVAPKCDRRTKAGKETYAAFQDAAGDKTILTDADYATIQSIAAEIEKHKVIKFVQDGASEVCIVWTDKKTGILCKARLDYIHAERAIMVDIKSTKSAEAGEFARSVWNYDYHQQFAFYASGWEAAAGDFPTCVIVACEKEPPFALAVYELHEDIMRAGKNAWENALKIYAECVKTGIWPGFYDGPQILNLPKWALEKAGVGPHNLDL